VKAGEHPRKPKGFGSTDPYIEEGTLIMGLLRVYPDLSIQAVFQMTFPEWMLLPLTSKPIIVWPSSDPLGPPPPIPRLQK
jgi:hypothetical protein